MWENLLSEHQIRGWRDQFLLQDCRANGWHERNVFSQTHIYIYIYIYVYTYIYIYIHKQYIYIYTLITHIYPSIYLSISLSLYIYIYIYVCTTHGNPKRQKEPQSNHGKLFEVKSRLTAGPSPTAHAVRPPRCNRGGFSWAQYRAGTGGRGPLPRLSVFAFLGVHRAPVLRRLQLPGRSAHV